jgi:hypothetical protein
LTESRSDIRWLIGRRTKPTFCVFSALNLAVMESVVALVVTGNTISVSDFSISEGAGVS